MRSGETISDLQRSEALKNAILEAALDCIVTVTDDSRVVEWNPAAAETFGYSRAEALGKDLCDLIIPPESQDAHRQGMRRYLETGLGPVIGRRVEVEAVRHTGERFPVELAISPITLDGRPHFTAYIRDITERRKWAAHQRLLINELNHRVKNTLATVQSLAAQTFRAGVDLALPMTLSPSA